MCEIAKKNRVITEGDRRDNNKLRSGMREEEKRRREPRTKHGEQFIIFCCALRKLIIHASQKRDRCKMENNMAAAALPRQQVRGGVEVVKSYNSKDYVSKPVLRIYLTCKKL